MDLNVVSPTEKLIRSGFQIMINLLLEVKRFFIGEFLRLDVRVELIYYILPIMVLSN